MTLLQAEIGKEYQVETLSLERAVEGRLQALGLTEGTMIKVLNHKRGGSVIFNVRGTRLAVGKQIADSITLQPIGIRE